MRRWRTFGTLLLAAVALANHSAPALAVDPSPRDGRAGAATGAAAAAEGVTQTLPVSIWELPAASGGYDGIGSWIATANDPTALPGQVAVEYAYVHEFNFVNHPDADALIVLSTDPGGKSAEFFVTWEDGRRAIASVPFNWTGGRFYFPLVYRLADGIYGGWVYDHAASTWTYIGTLVVPTDWGKISPVSYTFVDWYGELPVTCAGYPSADVYRYPPTGLVGGSAVQATLDSFDSGPGDCPGTVATENGNWSHYRLGSAVGP